MIPDDQYNHEYLGLNSAFALADAHAYHAMDADQEAIIASLPQVWKEAALRKQGDVEEEFLRTYYTVKGELSALNQKTSMITYSALTSVAIMADYLLMRGKSISLVEPTFYRLYEIMHNSGVPVHAFDEKILFDIDNLEENLEKHVKGDALFLVDINNPSGQSFYGLGRGWYEKVLRFAKAHNKLLILDFCFNWFDPAKFDGRRFDLYQMLDDSGVDYIAMEDYAKIFPLKETKASILKTSPSVFTPVCEIQKAYLLNVSPFVLTLATKFLTCLKETGGLQKVYNLVEENRALLKQTLTPYGCFDMAPINTHASVSWVKITRDAIASDELVSFLKPHGFYMIPGTFYFYSSETKGRDFLRVALLRDKAKFELAMKRLKELLDEFLSI